jgi:hypothetical protein
MKYLDSSVQDMPQLEKWVAKDPIHNGTIDPSFWIRPLDENGIPENGIKCLRIEDDNGAVFYMRLENALRVYIQFPPEEEVSKSRVASALRRMFWFVGGGSKKAGYQEAIFDSTSPHLVSFLKVLGFKILENTYKVKL